MNVSNIQEATIMAQTAEEKRIANNAAVAKHHEKLMLFKVQPLKEEGQAIKDYAQSVGLSAQKLFLEAVREYMTRHPVKLETPKKEEQKVASAFEPQAPQEVKPGTILKNPHGFTTPCIYALVVDGDSFIGDARKGVAKALEDLEFKQRNGLNYGDLQKAFSESNGNYKIVFLEKLEELDDNYVCARLNHYRTIERARKKRREEEQT